MTLIELPDLEQGSAEWLAARRGMVTASVVGQLITTYTLGTIDYPCPACPAGANESCRSKRAPFDHIKTMHPERTEFAAQFVDSAPPMLVTANNETSRGLAATLAAERITGWSEPSYMNDDMMRGVMHEPYARQAYMDATGYKVRETGFMVRDERDWQLGYSPDGLIGDDGALEVKCPRAKTHVRTILADKVPAHYMAQCQAGLLVTGRDWIDFVSFVAGMPLYIKRVTPDPQWQQAIEAACRAFEVNVGALIKDYWQRVDGLPMTERIDSDLGLVF